MRVWTEAGTGTGGQAEALRNEAKAASRNGDVATATAKFQAAIAADPKSPWICPDYARFLAGQGHASSRRSLRLIRLRPATRPTSVRWSPPCSTRSRTNGSRRWTRSTASRPISGLEDVKNFRDRIYVRGTIERAKQLAASGDTAQARSILIQLYQDPTVTTDEKLQAPFVIVDLLHVTIFDGAADHPRRLREEADPPGQGGWRLCHAAADAGRPRCGGRAGDGAQVTASGQVNNSNREQLTPVYVALAIRTRRETSPGTTITQALMTRSRNCW